MRLDKFLVEAAIGKRKDTRVLIQQGFVQVNGVFIAEPAQEVDEFSDVIEYQGETIHYPGKKYYMFHKPMDCITARRDAVHRTVLDFFTEEDGRGIFPVGRLDKDTEGLLLLTNDGEFDQRLMNPKMHVSKTYFFWALGTLDEEKQEQLRAGVSIGDGEAITKPAIVQVLGESQYDQVVFDLSLKEDRNIKKSGYAWNATSGYLTITEGRKHQVKRMLKAVGCYCFYLKRVAIGDVYLDETLRKGQYRTLTEVEVKKLMEEFQ